MPGIDFSRASAKPYPGLKARNVIVQAEGLGSLPFIRLEPCKGDTNLSPSFANYCMDSMLGDADDVPPIQGGAEMGATYSRGFTPGYNMTGLQPVELGSVSQSIIRQSNKRAPRSYHLTPEFTFFGLKAHNVIAQAEGLGATPPNVLPACKPARPGPHNSSPHAP